MKQFQSIFADYLKSYVKLRQGLGLRFTVQGDILHAFDKYLCGINFTGALTQELAMDFAGANSNTTSVECARRYQVVRHFSEYLAVFEPATPYLVPKALYRKQRTFSKPYILSSDELTRILDAARHISRSHPARGVTLYTMIGLAAACGLRISEVVKLGSEHVDLKSGVIFISASKFNKDRLVPLHPTTVEALEQYAALRDAVVGKKKSSAFFLNYFGGRFSKHTLQILFAQAVGMAGVKSGGRKPTFHDLRHTFAVTRLQTWYKEGVDIQTKLPHLATYLGHAHYTDTAYYLTATPELLALAAERYQNNFGKLEIPE
jgi:integrase